MALYKCIFIYLFTYIIKKRLMSFAFEKSPSKLATTPDKTVETFQYNFQVRAMLPLCPKATNSPPSPPMVQCCFGTAAQACISCITANNIAIGEGGNSLLFCDSKHFCQGECKKIGIFVMCLSRFCPRL